MISFIRSQPKTLLGKLMLGVNDSGRLALVRKDSPQCCVLVEKTEYPALAAFEVRRRGCACCRSLCMCLVVWVCAYLPVHVCLCLSVYVCAYQGLVCSQHMRVQLLGSNTYLDFRSLHTNRSL